MLVFYLCNGTNPHCCNCAGCYKHGGECRHTRNLEYATTEFCVDPTNCPDRFEAVSNNDDICYFEKEGMSK